MATIKCLRIETTVYPFVKAAGGNSLPLYVSWGSRYTYGVEQGLTLSAILSMEPEPLGVAGLDMLLDPVHDVWLFQGPYCLLCSVWQRVEALVGKHGERRHHCSTDLARFTWILHAVLAVPSIIPVEAFLCECSETF